MMPKVMTGGESAEFLRKIVPVCKGVIVKDVEEALKFGKKIGYPVVLKILSKSALHKTEIKGVRIASDEAGSRKEFEILVKIANSRKLPLEGILVQEEIHGREILIGLKKDPTFGHVLVFGLGGVFVEVLKDVSFRVCPINLEDAQEMIDELRGKVLIYGIRKSKALNIDLLKKTMVAVSKLPSRYPAISELDINPFILNDKDGYVCDARVVWG